MAAVKTSCSAPCSSSRLTLFGSGASGVRVLDGGVEGRLGRGRAVGIGAVLQQHAQHLEVPLPGGQDHGRRHALVAVVAHGVDVGPVVDEGLREAGEGPFLPAAHRRPVEGRVGLAVAGSGLRPGLGEAVGDAPVHQGGVRVEDRPHPVEVPGADRLEPGFDPGYLAGSALPGLRPLGIVQGGIERQGLLVRMHARDLVALPGELVGLPRRHRLPSPPHRQVVAQHDLAAGPDLLPRQAGVGADPAHGNGLAVDGDPHAAGRRPARQAEPHVVAAPGHDREPGGCASLHGHPQALVLVVEVQVDGQSVLTAGRHVPVDGAHGVHDLGGAAGVVALAGVRVVVAPPPSDRLGIPGLFGKVLLVRLGGLSGKEAGPHQALHVVVAAGVVVDGHPQGQPRRRPRRLGVGQGVPGLVGEDQAAEVVGHPAALVDDPRHAGAIGADHGVDVLRLARGHAVEQQAAEGVEVGLPVALGAVRRREMVRDGALVVGGVRQVERRKAVGQVHGQGVARPPVIPDQRLDTAAVGDGQLEAGLVLRGVAGLQVVAAPVLVDVGEGVHVPRAVGP